MICVVALIVFAVLAVFSARYKPLAGEAFDCVFRRVTLRRCRSGLDKQLKSQITGRVMRRNKRVGRFLYHHFEVFSWLFLILLILSLAQVGASAYNLVVYGNCYGLDDEGFCVFDPLAVGHEKVSLCTDGAQAVGHESLVAPDYSLLAGNPRTGSATARVTVIEFGCFGCPNTAEQAPAVKELVEHFGQDIQFVFVDLPLLHHDYAAEASLAAQCVYEQDAMAYWRYHFLLFRHQEELSPAHLRAWAGQLGIAMLAFDRCVASDEAQVAVDGDVALAHDVGIYGTPTFFIDDEPVVGVKSFRFLREKVARALAEANN
ncbi:DsbA family protein [Candidatus Woesearchaeota archaeon]|nr:DsbA family protein [Candidatus Woesearchaeota archaeon]